MFPRSERFVEKINITPGPNHYDVKLNDDDPYKRFGFLGKQKRFAENAKDQLGPCGTISGRGIGPYERNALSVSLPSLVIDDDATSPDTASVHSNGSTTPDYTKYSARRPSTPRSRSSDKLGSAFAANSSRTEERLKRELADLNEKFEKYRISHQRDLDVMNEKQKKGEVMYQSAIKEKNSILTQLASKELEIADLGARHTMLKATLEKSEKAAAQVTDKISKTTQLQKRIDELEKLLSRTKLSVEEQETNSNEIRSKFDQERRLLKEQVLQQKELTHQELLQAREEKRLADERYREAMDRTKEDLDFWKRRVEELEKIIRDLERQLEAERRTIEELRAMMKKEREQLQEQVDQAQERIAMMEKETTTLQSSSEDAISQLQSQKEDIDRQLQATRLDLTILTEKHDANERMLQEQIIRHADTVDVMTQQHAEQQARLENEHQEHIRTKQELEQSIAHLNMELGQNTDALLKVQEERSHLQGKYEQSQLELGRISREKEILKEQHEKLQESFTEEQKQWSAKYDVLVAQSTNDRKESDAVISEVKMALQARNEDYERVTKSIDAVQTELKALESQREEAVALRLEEKRKMEANLQQISRLEEENHAASEQVEAVQIDKEALQKEHEKLQEEFRARELASRQSFASEIEQIKAEKEAQGTTYQTRIQELEEAQRVSIDRAETFRESEKTWESERAKLLEEALIEKNKMDSLQSGLKAVSNARDRESKASAEHISELESRCHAMERAFRDLFEKSASTHEIIETNPDDIWQQHSQAVLHTLVNHTVVCSTIKAEHEALVQEKSALEKAAASVKTSLQEKESFFSKSESDNSELLAKVADLEDQIRLLKVQVELLEAENIGKVAIIKALQDEYEYQEKVIRELSKYEDASKEVLRLEEELKTMISHTRDKDEWIKQAQEDIEKYRAAYVKADVAREETLLDMAKLHEELAESENTRLEVENQLQVEVSVLIKKHALTGDELSRLSKMNVQSAQNLSLKQKVKQVAQLKEENLALKKKNLGLSNTRDSLRLKCLHVERELEAYKAANVSMSSDVTTSGVGLRPSRSSSISGASSVISSSSALLGSGASTVNLVVTEQLSPTTGKLQLQGLTAVATTETRPRSASTASTRSSHGGSTKVITGSTKTTINVNSAVSKPPIRSRAARSYLAGHSTTS
ncbi:hypothetical protein BGX28_008851 [Mortierella sp. GBA30]|nr:hypothetical protein BGX28_008851 [Mortierella sp. GBA30]